MKTNLLSLIFLIASVWKTVAQPTDPQGDANYNYPQINGPLVGGVQQPLTTDPRNTNWPGPPYDPDFKRNRFPWFSESSVNTGINPFYQYKFRYKYPATIQDGEIKSPFAANDALPYTAPLRFQTENSNAGNVSPDYLPEDGWELVKQSMGYLKNDNTGIPKADDVSAFDPDPKMIPYVLLHNKFSGNLRILAYGGHIWGTSPEGNIAVNMVLNQSISGPPKNFSGLLNAYGEIYTPLDEKTKVKFVQSLAVFPGSVGFFWTDFQMSYDPCVCFYESWVTFDFVQIETYSIQGFTQSITLDEEIDAEEAANYLAAVWKVDRDGEAFYNGMLNYKSGPNLKEELIASINANANYIKKDKMLEYVEKLGEILAESSDGIAGEDPEPESKALAEAVKYCGKGIQFFAASLESPISKATKTAGAFRGTVTRTSNNLIVKADLATPGSWDVKNRAGEFFPDPEYPEYNETMGTVAFLTTPKVQSFVDYDDSDCNIFTMIDGGYYDYALKLIPSSLLYKFNPLLDLKDYEIEVSLDADVEIANMSKYLPSEGSFHSATTTPVFKNWDLYAKKEGILDLHPENDRQTYYDKYSVNTPWQKLSCAGNVTGYVHIDDFGTCYSSPTFLRVARLELKVLVTMTSNKLNRFGKPLRNVQLFTLPVLLVPTNTHLQNDIAENPSPFNDGGIPFNLTIGNRVFQVNDNFSKIYAHEKIIANGAIYNFEIENGQKKEVSFIAGKAIEYGPGFEVGGLSPVYFYTGSVYSQNCLPQDQVQESANSFVNSFCKKVNPLVKYAANQSFSREVTSTDNIISPKAKESILFYPIPNPTKSICQLSFDLAEPSGYEMHISNAMGVNVMQLEARDFASSGKHTVNFSTERLEAGVYYISFSSDGFRQARKLVVVK